MTKSKKSIVMRGALLRPLVIGQGALLHAGGKIYHTSRVVAIHDQSAGGLQPAPDGEPGRVRVKRL